MDETSAFLAELARAELDAFGENDAIVPPGERACPICGQHMDVELMSGTNIDVCAEHGIWLDRGELPNILKSSNSSVRRANVDAIRKAKREGKHAGIIFGVWSLLGD